MPIVKCRKCKTKFYAKPHWLKVGWGKYCSSKCQYEAQKKGNYTNCAICGKKIWRAPHEFVHSKSGKFFCGKACQTIWRNKEFRGSRHHNWKGGENIIHKSLLIENHVKLVCKLCNCKDERVLAVHHLDKNRKNNDIENLIFLCHNCHHLVHCHNQKI